MRLSTVFFDESTMNHSGIIILNKPEGETSRQTLNRLKRLAKPAKVGHAGTLDPIAKGVLLACVGKATRLIDAIHLLPKHYIATFRLGWNSDTEDVTGNLTAVENPKIPNLADIEKTIPLFTGRIEQRPPMFSALKVNGKRAYDLARKGQTVELKSRKIDVFEIKMLQYEYPKLVLGVLCGSGTYIRSLGRDIAEHIGTKSVMEELVRDFIGPFRLVNAIMPDFFVPENIENWKNYLLPMEQAVEHLPQMQVDEQIAQKILHGLKITVQDAFFHEKTIAVLNSEQKLISLLEPSEGNVFKPKVNFS